MLKTIIKKVIPCPKCGEEIKVSVDAEEIQEARRLAEERCRRVAEGKK